MIRQPLLILALLASRLHAEPITARPDEWTVGTSQEYILRIIAEKEQRYEQKFDAQEDAVRAALESADKAILKSEADTKIRFDTTNEFRGQLKDQAATFIQRVDVEQRLSLINDRISAIERQLSVGVGATTQGHLAKEDTKWFVAFLVATGVAIAAIVYGTRKVKSE